MPNKQGYNHRSIVICPISHQVKLMDCSRVCQTANKIARIINHFKIVAEATYIKICLKIIAIV